MTNSWPFSNSELTAYWSLLLQPSMVLCSTLKLPGNRVQTNRNYPAEYRFIRKRIIPLGKKQILYWTIRFHLDTKPDSNFTYPDDTHKKQIFFSIIRLKPDMETNISHTKIDYTIKLQ